MYNTNMDLHPLFVHFPIALLCLASFLELTRRFVKNTSSWAHVRTVLYVTGTLGAFVALSTGEGAEHLFQNRDLRPVLHMHSLIANVTTWIYAVLALGYLLPWLEESFFVKRLPVSIKRPYDAVASFANILTRTPLSDVLAVLGFLGLLFVGALGAILVYGPDFDPITRLVYGMLF